MDFLVASSNVGLHYRFGHLEFNIKCDEYFDAAKISYLGWYEWNGAPVVELMITSISIESIGIVGHDNIMGYLGRSRRAHKSRRISGGQKAYLNIMALP
jgi:hypothetical protein